jgi:hypothetical protein
MPKEPSAQKPTPPESKPQTPTAPDHSDAHEGATEDETQPIKPPWADLPENNPEPGPGADKRTPRGGVST